MSVMTLQNNLNIKYYARLMKQCAWSTIFYGIDKGVYHKQFLIHNPASLDIKPCISGIFSC